MDISDRLRYARECLKLTLSEVKSQTGIGESSISDFENRKREPSLNQLNALASTYKRNLSFFLDQSAVSSEAIIWRKRPEEGAEKMEATFRQLCERYQTLKSGQVTCAMLVCPNPKFRPINSDIEMQPAWRETSGIFCNLAITQALRSFRC